MSTGCGGGGSTWCCNSYGNGGGAGGAGGSGVVIIRIPTASYSGTTSGSPSLTTDGSYKVLTYNSSGTYTA